MYRKYRRSYRSYRWAISAIGSLILMQFIFKNFKLVVIVAFSLFVHFVCKRFGLYRNISNERRKIKFGKIGEHRVNSILKTIGLTNILINDINIGYDGYESQIDHILITNKGIFNIETKNYSGTLRIYPNGEWKQTTSIGEHSIDNFARQALKHRRTLTNILGNKYQIIDIIVIANEDTDIIGSKNSEVPIVRIDKLKEYIENATSQYDDYDLDKISEVILSYKIPSFRRSLIRSKYFIRTNKVAISLIILIMAIFYTVINPLPNSLITDIDKSSEEISASVLSVSLINQKINFAPLNTSIEILKMSKYKDQITINIDVTNNEKNNSLYVDDFKFFVSDDKNKLYKADSYLGNSFVLLDSIEPLETKQVLLKVYNTNDIKVNKLIIKYDDLVTQKIEKEVRLSKPISDD